MSVQCTTINSHLLLEATADTSDPTINTSGILPGNSPDYEAAAAACAVLHHVLYFRPTADYIAKVGSRSFLEQWPHYGDDQADAIFSIVASAADDTFEAIEKDYYRLFIGPGVMDAYPWGSVYTDQENLVCGDTTRQFKQFCISLGIEFQLRNAEPEDHIGLVIAALSRIFEQACETGNLQPAGYLLADHLLPWSHRVIARVRQSALTGYYLGFMLLLENLLAYWQKALGVVPRELQLFA